jgi:hypothetical protein
MASLRANAIHVTHSMVARDMCFASLALACGLGNAASPGVIGLTVGGDTLLHVGSPLLRDDRVHLQYPDQAGAPRCCVVRGARAFEAVVADPAASDALSGNPVFGYRLIRPLRLKNKKPFLGAAIVGRSIQVKQSDGHLIGFSRSNRLLTVSTCTSQEGFHVVAAGGKAARSDLYLGLGYEVEGPTCLPK